MIGVVMVLVAAVLGYLLPWAVPCVALLAGVLAGYLGARALQPATIGLAARTGTGAGALAGLGALLGHVFSGVAAISLAGPIPAAALIERFGPSVDATSPASYYATALAFACCAGLVEVVLMAALGAVGGIVWHRATQRRPAARWTSPS
jgi:hypothetical protein